MKYIALLHLRLIVIIGLFILGMGFILFNGLNSLSVICSTAAFGAYSLINIVGNYRRHESFHLFTHQGVVFGGLAWGVMILSYAYFSDKLTEEIAGSVVTLLVVSVFAIISSKQSNN